MIIEKTTDFANQVDDGQTVGISFHYYNEKNNRFVSSLVKKLLERQSLEYLRDTVTNILRELIVNAVKANSKRYYFLHNKWDIANQEQYLEGMEQFKDGLRLHVSNRQAASLFRFKPGQSPSIAAAIMATAQA